MDKCIVDNKPFLADNKLMIKKGYPKVAVDMVILSIIERKLCGVLIQIKNPPFEDFWAFPGGLVGMNESLDEAAIRVLKEKTGIGNVYMEQLYTFGAVNRDIRSRAVPVVYYALIDSSKVELSTKEGKYKDIKWMPMEDIPSLAYDHNDIAKLVLSRLKSKLAYTNIVYSLLPKNFTLSRLQEVYEIILGKKLDKRNFRKKIMTLKLFEKTNFYATDGAHRPAALYEFKERKPKIIEIL